MVELRWTEEAARWLEDIHKYISNDNPKVAREVVSGIYNKVQLLTSFPEIGYMYNETDQGEIRILLYGHYRIAYLKRADSIIEILGIFHGALDIDKYML